MLISYVWFVFGACRVFLSNVPLPCKFLVLPVVATPLGKLLYLPVIAVDGLKASFVLCALGVGVFTFNTMVKRKRFSAFIWLQLICMVPIGLSLLGVDKNINIIWDRLYESQYDSILLRSLSYLIFATYGCFVAASLKKQPPAFQELLINSFLQSTVVATLLGVVIFAGVWVRALDVVDLTPISVDTHIVDNFYRFNPGANVNEFGVLAGYAIFFVQYRAIGHRMTLKDLALISLFGAALFASLTRGAWVAFTLATVLYSLYSARRLKRLAIVGGLTALAIATLSLVNENVALIIDTRFSMDLGAGGEERLEKFQWAIHGFLNDSWLQFLIGHGWATNLYAHSIFFQLIYEVGVIGFLIFMILLLAPIVLCSIRAVTNPRFSVQRQLLSAMGLFLVVVAMLHHTMYHVQTWLVFGFILAGAESQSASKNVGAIKSVDPQEFALRPDQAGA